MIVGVYSKYECMYTIFADIFLLGIVNGITMIGKSNPNILFTALVKITL